MFKKLRNKFLILNLVIISVMMLFSFTSIYLVTYNNVQRDISGQLHKIMESNIKPKEIQKSIPKEPRTEFETSEPPSERSVSFTIITDSQWNIIDYSSIFDMDKGFYESIKKVALLKNTETGHFRTDDNSWAFIIRPYLEGHKIVIVDITSQQAILTNLIYTFLAVASAMLLVIFFISRFFANRAIEPIKETFYKQKQFIADASHELKTPLAVINTNVDVLLSNPKDNIENQSKWLYYIKSEVERMTNLTNSLLYLTKIDYSEVKMIFTSFNLSEAVESVILTMEAVIFENNISLNYDIEPNLMVRGNLEQLKQVVMILLDNALKYTSTKGTVNLSLKKYNNAIVLTVTNTGQGIPDEHLAKIFDRFYRADKSRARKSGGYGLGLAIAKTIVEQHRGKIYAKSILNQSTTFTVELPFSS